ncbi:MAG: presenilin family intramembrane aspartyl protease PSH, partial [Methanobacteriota archaeon]
MRASEAPPVLFLAFLFTLSIGLAVAIWPTYSAQNYRAFEDPEDVRNPLYYLVIVVAFTAFLLLLAKYRWQRVIQIIILGAVFATIFYVLYPLLSLALVPPLPAVLGLAVAIVLAALLYFYPEWYIIDAVGVLVSSGAAAIFGISFGLLPALVLLVAFAAYDFIAVYRTKHMIDLADSVLTLRLPIMLVVPKTRRY